MKFGNGTNSRFFLNLGLADVISLAGLSGWNDSPSISMELLEDAFRDFPDEKSLTLTFSTKEASQTLQSFHQGLKRTLVSDKKPNCKMKNFAFAYRSEIMSLVDQIKTKNMWSLVADLYDLSWEMQANHQTEFLSVFASIFAKTIHLLLGSETEFLAGTRGNHPSWKRFRYALQAEERFWASWTFYAIDSEIRYLGGEDLDMVPDPMESVPVSVIYEMPDHFSPEEIVEVVKSTYYDQKYILASEGYRVTFGAECTPFIGVTLKRKRSLTDPNCTDLLALYHIEHLGGCLNFLNVIDGGQLTDRYVPYRGIADLDIIACSIYKQFVTADIKVGKDGFVSFVNFGGATAKCRVTQHLARRPLEHKRPCRHPVRGHLRGKEDKPVPMSHDHRLDVQDFERLWGVDIIDHPRFHREYQTIVLPFSSPKITDEVIQAMPEFAIRNYQQVIYDSLSFKINE